MDLAADLRWRLDRVDLAERGIARGQHPGVLLQRELVRLDESQADFARRVMIPGPNINQIIHGNRQVGVVTALALEYGTGVDAALWLALQADYSLARARTVGHLMNERPVDVHVETADDDLAAYRYRWFVDVGGHQLDGYVQNVWDVTLQAQQAVIEATGLDYWQFRLRLVIDGVEPDEPDHTADRATRDARAWFRRIQAAEQ